MLVITILCISSIAVSQAAPQTSQDEGFFSSIWSFIASIFSGDKITGAAVIGTPVLSSTSGNNLITDDLTVTYTLDSGEKGIIDWRKDSSSIAVLNMPFENNTADTSTTTKDYSGYGNNGNVNGAAFNPTGGYDGKGAYEFDGSGDYIRTSGVNGVNLEKATISLWFKADIFDNYENLFVGSTAESGNNNWRFERGNGYDGCIGSRMRVQAGNAASTSNLCTTTEFNPGTWYHIVTTREKVSSSTSDISVYVNGELEDNQILSSTFSTFADFRIAYGWGSTSARFFDGAIDEVRIYNYSLSPEQIKALYNSRTDLIVSQETDYGDIWQVREET